MSYDLTAKHILKERGTNGPSLKIQDILTFDDMLKKMVTLPESKNYVLGA
jgi:hypothetical protein